MIFNNFFLKEDLTKNENSFFSTDVTGLTTNPALKKQNERIFNLEDSNEESEVVPLGEIRKKQSLIKDYHRLVQIVFDYELKSRQWDCVLSENSETFLNRFCDVFIVPSSSKELM